MEPDELIDALYELLEPGDHIVFTTGQEYEIINLLPSHIMWEDKSGETSLMSWKEFIKIIEWNDKNQPRLVKCNETEEYKKASDELDAWMNYWEKKLKKKKRR